MAVSWIRNPFFADFVLANYLLDPQLSDGRFGYQMLSPVGPSKTLCERPITDLSNRINEYLDQYATDYYEIALPESDQAIQLELTLQFPIHPHWMAGCNSCRWSMAKSPCSASAPASTVTK